MSDVTDALRAALYAMPTGVAILDRQGNLVFANTIVETIMPDRVEAGGDTLSAILSFDARSMMKSRSYSDPRRDILYRYVDDFCIAFISARDVWLTTENIYGLTNAECTVVEELINGRSPPEIAESYGLKLGTVSKHLKRIYPKVDAYRQADLVRVILTGPAGVQWP